MPKTTTSRSSQVAPDKVPGNRVPDVKHPACASGASARRVARPGGTTPYLEFTEQPDKARFRYDSDEKSKGSIPGVYSTKDNKTFPKVKIHNYIGLAKLRASLVTKDKPYRAHPHGLLGKVCENYVYETMVQVTEDECEFEIRNLGIKIASKTQTYNVETALTLREDMGVDPFKQGFAHKLQSPKSYDVKAVRLCFELWVLNSSGQWYEPQEPVVSDVIYDKKSNSNLQIVKTSSCSGPAVGGNEVIVLCDKVPKDIKVMFYRKINEKLKWRAYVDRVVSHYNTALYFNVPPYEDTNIKHEVHVSFCLYRPSDETYGKPCSYSYIPDFDEEILARKKRKKISLILTNHKDWLPKSEMGTPSSEIKCEEDMWRLRFDNVNQIDSNHAVPVGDSSHSKTVATSSHFNLAVSPPNNNNRVVSRCSYNNPGVPGPVFKTEPCNPMPPLAGTSSNPFLGASYNIQSVSPSTYINPAATTSCYNNMESRPSNIDLTLPGSNCTPSIASHLGVPESNCSTLVTELNNIAQPLSVLSNIPNETNPFLSTPWDSQMPGQARDQQQYEWENLQNTLNVSQEPMISNMAAGPPQDSQLSLSKELRSLDLTEFLPKDLPSFAETFM